MINKIVFTSVWVFLVTVLLIVRPPVNSISVGDLETMNKGLELGKGIAEMIEKVDFEEFLTKVGKNIGGYLGAIGPFIGLITAFFPSKSEELAYMKKMMEFIDKRFDQMDKRFDTIEQMIKWNVVQVNFGQIEQRIRAMSREFGYLYSVPSGAVENRKKLYISNYESDYQNSGTKLYQAIVLKQGTFQEDLGTSVLRYTDSDRKKTQLFLLGVMQLLLQAVKIELAYLFANKYNDNANFMRLQWTNRIQEVRTKFKNIDDHCKNLYFSESSQDIEDYSAKNYGKPHNQFATELFQLLAGKYYWRDWIVVSYNPISGGRWHMMRVTGGLTLLRKHGRNLLVTSVDKNHPVMNLSRAEQKTKKIPMRFSKGNWFRGYSYYRRYALNIFNSLDKTGASLVSVITCNTKSIGVRSHTKRLFIDERCPYNWMIMWG